MKKLLCVLLSMLMLLTLAACANNVPDETEGEKEPEKLQLVTAYHSTNGFLTNYFGGEYTMEFTYNDSYTGGTVALRCGEELTAGQFSCDNDHNITGISIAVEEVQLQMDMTFDKHARLLTVRVHMRDDEQEADLYTTERRYDSKGRIIYNEQNMLQQELYTRVQTEYDARGFIVSQLTENKAAGQEYAQQILYSYDAEGYMTTIETRDGQGNVLMSMPFTWEETMDGVLYTYSEGAEFMTLLYDDKGHALQQEVYSSDGLVTKMVNTYDAAGRCIRTETQNAALGYIVCQEFEYLADGRQTVVRQYQGDELVALMETTYVTVTP